MLNSFVIVAKQITIFLSINQELLSRMSYHFSCAYMKLLERDVLKKYIQVTIHFLYKIYAFLKKTLEKYELYLNFCFFFKTEIKFVDNSKQVNLKLQLIVLNSLELCLKTSRTAICFAILTIKFNIRSSKCNFHIIVKLLD